MVPFVQPTLTMAISPLFMLILLLFIREDLTVDSIGC